MSFSIINDTDKLFAVVITHTNLQIYCKIQTITKFSHLKRNEKRAYTTIEYTLLQIPQVGGCMFADLRNYFKKIFNV